MISFFRFTIAILYIFIVAMLGIILSFFRPFNPSNLRPFARLIGLSRKVLGIDFQIRDKENLQVDDTAIYISNHQDNIDVIIGAQFIPYRTVSIGKTAILFAPFFGLFYYLTGNILINRKNTSKAHGSMDKAHEALTKNHTSIWIMPEGTRNKNNQMKPFKKGAFRMAIMTQVPIVPISISTYHPHLNFNKLKSGKVLVKIHRPIPTKGLSLDDRDELSRKCKNLIQEGINELDELIRKG